MSPDIRADASADAPAPIPIVLQPASSVADAAAAKMILRIPILLI
jgi:hypothetical protein